MTIIPCSRRMGHDITTDGLFLVASIWTCSRVWTGHDLIRYDHSNTKLTENGQKKMIIHFGRPTSSANRWRVRKNLPR